MAKKKHRNPEVEYAIAVEKGWRLEMVDITTHEWDYVKIIDKKKYKSNSNGKEIYQKEVLDLL